MWLASSKIGRHWPLPLVQALVADSTLLADLPHLPHLCSKAAVTYRCFLARAICYFLARVVYSAGAGGGQHPGGGPAATVEPKDEGVPRLRARERCPRRAAGAWGSVSCPLGLLALPSPAALPTHVAPCCTAHAPCRTCTGAPACLVISQPTPWVPCTPPRSSRQAPPAACGAADGMRVPADQVLRLLCRSVHRAGPRLVGTFAAGLVGQPVKLVATRVWLQAAEKELPGLADDIAAGKFERLKGWLNEKIHKASWTLELSFGGACCPRCMGRCFRSIGQSTDLCLSSLKPHCRWAPCRPAATS